MTPQLVRRFFDADAVRRLVAEGIAPPLARVLAARGIASLRELELAARDLIPPLQLSHVTDAARLLADRIEAGARLLIVADYDCDGATACAVGLRGLRMMGARVDYLVPNRFDYGYGLTPEIVDLAAAAAKGRPDLLITVDNGIASVAGVARANELGIEVLITDHHLPGERLPAAAVIVNPNQRGCGFPSKNLAGVGVMFYVLLALRAELRARGRYTEATAAAAERAARPRGGRHRGRRGSARPQQPDPGCGRARSGSATDRPRRASPRCSRWPAAARARARASDLGFTIGPRINAAGRLTDMTVGIECLTTDDPVRALELARQLDELNRERRAIEADMQVDALAELDEADLGTRRTITLFNEGWHQGVVGLVASRVKERHHRPTIAFARADEKMLRGSGRSIEGVHLRDVLDLVTKAAPSMIEKFGGHAMAAGLTLGAEHYEGFGQAFEAATRGSVDAELFARRVSTDGPLTPSDISLALTEAIDRQIWGQGFAPPLFDNEFAVVEQRLIKEQHLKLTLELDGNRFSGIWFRRTQPLPTRVRLAYRPMADEYQGQRRISLHIEHASL